MWTKILSHEDNERSCGIGFRMSRIALVLFCVSCAGAFHSQERERLGLGQSEFSRVCTLLAGGRIIEARQALAEMPHALREKPAWSYLMGRTLLAQDDPVGAVTYLEQARNRAFGSAAIDNDLAVALVRVGRADQALALLDALSSMRPDDKDIALNRAVARLEAGLVAEAVQSLGNLARQWPDWFEARYNLGIALLRNGDSQAAVVELREALRIRPGDKAALVALAQACMQSGNRTCADQAVKEALSRHSADAKVIVTSGLFLEGQGNLASALNQYRQATVVDPACAVCWYNLGRLAERQGDLQTAALAYRRHVELEKDKTRLEAVKMRLRALSRGKE